MWRVFPLVLLVAFVAACGGITATTAPSPTVAAPSPTPTPSPTTDPACDSDNLRAVLRDIDDYTTRGAFEVKPKTPLEARDVYRWRFGLNSVENAAELQLYKAAKSAGDAVADWTRQDPGSLAQRINALTIQLAAKTLAIECRVHDEYAFSRIE